MLQCISYVYVQHTKFEGGSSPPRPYVEKNPALSLYEVTESLSLFMYTCPPPPPHTLQLQNTAEACLAIGAAPAVDLTKDHLKVQLYPHHFPLH